MSRRKKIFVLLLLCMMLLPTTTAYATSLSDLVADTTAAATTQAATEAATEAQDFFETQEYVHETIGYSDDSFANQLANTANMSKANTQTTAFSKLVNGVCTIAFQYIAALISGLSLVCIALDMLFITVPPVRTFLANGYVGNPSSDRQQSQANAGMGGAMGNMSGYRGASSYDISQTQRTGVQTAQQNQPALGRIQWISNAALNAVAEESSAKKSALIDYGKDIAVRAVLSIFILVVAASGILAKVGVWLGTKLIAMLSNVAA